MTNAFLDPQEYVNTMLLMVKNQLVMGRLVDGQFKNEVSDENGLTTNIKRPPRFVDKKDGTANLALQDIVTGTAPITVDQYSKVHVGIGDIEYVQHYTQLMQNATMKSAAQTLAHSIDAYLADQTIKFPSWVAGGDPTDTDVAINASDPTKPIASSAQAIAALTRMAEYGVPVDDLSGVMTFQDAQRVVGGLQTSPNDKNAVAIEAYRVPMISQVDWYATQQLPRITTGTRPQGDGASTGVQIDAASQNVNYRDVKGSPGVVGMTQTLLLKGATAGGTIAAGEVFTIQGCYAWDWNRLAAMDNLQQFTVLSAATADGTGDVEVTISPAIIVQGTNDGHGTDTNTAFGTVSAAPALNAYVKFAGAASTALRIRSAFHRRGISMVSTRLHEPFDGVASFAVDPDTGIAIRYWRGSDITTGKHVHRWDCMYGATVLDPFLGTRVCGT